MKNSNKIISTLIIASTLLIYIACKKESVNSSNQKSNYGIKDATNVLVSSQNSSLINNYANLFINTKGSISLNISSYSGLSTQTVKQIKSGASFLADFNSLVKSVVVDGTSMEKNINPNYSFSYPNGILNNTVNNAFGKNIKFAIELNDLHNRGNTVKEFTMYVPSDFQINPSTFLASLDLADNPNGLKTIKTNTSHTISWNQDINNANGVAIIVEWDGDIYEDQTRTSVHGRVKNIDIVPDNGTYNLSTSNFKDIPDNALITIYLARGNTRIENIMGNDLLLYGFTYYSAGSFYKKSQNN